MKDNEQKKEYRVGYHLLIPIPLREKLDVLSVAVGKPVSELILEAVVEKYFSGAPAVIESPAKGE